MKRNNKITKFGWYYFLGFLILLLGAFFWNDYKWNGTSDLKIGIITNDKVSVLILSPSRRMINRIETQGNTPILINGGYGWYEANKIKKLLEQENKTNLAKEIFFYNFGVIVDRVEWQDRGLMVGNLGIWGYIRFRISGENYLSNKEILATDKEKNEALLDEVGMRDLADSEILAQNLKVSIYNNSNTSGLAVFMGKRFDWMGLSVIETNNAIDNKTEMCKVVNGSEKIKKLLKEIWDCEYVDDKNLDNKEMEIYFGEKFAKMLKY